MSTEVFGEERLDSPPGILGVFWIWFRSRDSQQLPAFTAQQTGVNDDQKDWITRRVKDGPIRLVVCSANYSSKSTKVELQKYQLRAKNSCDFAKSMVGGLGVPPIVSTKLVKKANSALNGAVFLSFTP